ncbi:MAG: LysR family transcriptional regulator [Myxococcota bacterium]
MSVDAWDDLRILLAVARAGSATVAARQLGLAPSTLTRRIASLEGSVGAPLFLRTRDGMRATPAGEQLAAAAERISAEVARVSASVWPADAVRGVVRVATTEGLATLLAELGLARLCAEHRGLELEILAGNAEVDLAAGEADLALRLVRPRSSDLKVRKLSTLALWVAAAPDYLDRRGAPHDEASLVDHDVVLPAGELANLPEARWLAAVPGVRPTIRTSSMPALAAAVRDGAGIGVLPAVWATWSGGLRLLFEAPVAARHLWLVTGAASAERLAVRVVADRLVALLGQV